MKKTFKRLGAMFLAMVMAVSVLCTGAFAEDTTYTITINNETNGYTYAAYQVFKGDLHTETDAEGKVTKKVLSNIQWGSAVTDASAMLNAIKDISVNSEKPFSACTDAASVANVLNGQADKSEMAKAFAKVVGDQLKNATSTNSTYVNATGSTEQDNYVAAHYTIGINDAGYYLVKNTNVPTGDTTGTAYTNYILEVVGNVSVEPKVGVPTVTKKVQNTTAGETTGKDATTANIGDTVTFTLTGTLPDNYDDYKSYKYVFHDNLQAGLTLDKNSITVYKDTVSDSNKIDKSKYSTSSYETTSGYAFDLTFTDLKDSNLALDLTKTSKIIVVYSATLNNKAVVGTTGNQNTVYLNYSNDPNGTTNGKTPEDVVKVYTFQLNITKVDAQNKDTKLKDAKFVLSTQDKLNLGNIDDSGVPATKTDLIAVKGNTPNYTVDDAPDTEATKNTYVMSTDDRGALNISGLKPGKYYLYETKAPDGYNRRTTAIPIEIKATITKNSVTSLTINADNEKDQGSEGLKWTTGNTSTGIVSATITNTAGSNLPSTGGMGTKLFYTIGGLLMAGAAIVLVIKKRRSSAE